MSKILNDIARTKLRTAQKAFTRKKAEKAINASNCGEDRFVKHPNKHVKARAAHLAAKKNAVMEAGECGHDPECVCPTPDVE